MSQGEQPKTFEELLSAFGEFEKRVQEDLKKAAAAGGPSGPPAGWDRFVQFTNSGLFFMLVGVAFLLVAALTMYTSHSAFSFILVVIGVAIVLYGTGTQGVGQAEAIGYKVAIAGGAGIIAFCVGWGILEKSDKIKTVFQIEKKFVRVSLEGLEGAQHIANYVAAISINGVGIPVARHAESLEAFIPVTAIDWLERDINSVFVESNERSFNRCATSDAPSSSPKKSEDFIVRTLRVHLVPIVRTADFRTEVSDIVTIRLRRSMMSDNGSGQDFPAYAERVCVTLRSQSREVEERRSSSRASDTSSAVKPANPTIEPPKPGPPPLTPPDA